MTTYDTLREIRRRTEVIASHDESAMVKAMADIYWLCKEWHDRPKTDTEYDDKAFYNVKYGNR